MTSHSENVDAVIRNYRWSTEVTHEDFKLMMLGAAVIDELFINNDSHSVRVPSLATSELESVLALGSIPLHSWQEGEDGLICKTCGTLYSDCGSTAKTWQCPREDAAA